MLRSLFSGTFESLHGRTIKVLVKLLHKLVKTGQRQNDADNHFKIFQLTTDHTSSDLHDYNSLG